MNAIMLEFSTRENVELTAEIHLKDGEEEMNFSAYSCLFIQTFVTKLSKTFRYHVPRSWLNPTGNLLVVFEEWGGEPAGICLVKRMTGSVCADIFDGQPTLKKWRSVSSGKTNNTYPKAHLMCPPGQKISEIKFASYGLSQGTCGNYREGRCHAHKSYDALQKVHD